MRDQREQTVQDVLDAVNGDASGTSVDHRSQGKIDDGLGINETATDYGTESDYVVVNHRSGEVRVNDKTNPNWILIVG